MVSDPVFRPHQVLILLPTTLLFPWVTSASLLFVVMPYACCSVMVLKKLGDELMPDFHSVVEYLGKEQGMQVVVEPHEHAKMVHRHYSLAMQAGLRLVFACTAYLSMLSL